MSVFDIDSKEGKSQDDPHGGGNTEDGVDGGVDSGLLDPLVSSVFRRFSPVSRPGHGVTSLHVESPGHSWVLSHTQLLLSCRQELSQAQSQSHNESFFFFTNYLIYLNISKSAVILESDRTLQK